MFPLRSQLLHLKTQIPEWRNLLWLQASSCSQHPWGSLCCCLLARHPSLTPASLKGEKSAQPDTKMCPPAIHPAQMSTFSLPNTPQGSKTPSPIPISLSFMSPAHWRARQPMVLCHGTGTIRQPLANGWGRPGQDYFKWFCSEINEEAVWSYTRPLGCYFWLFSPCAASFSGAVCHSTVREVFLHALSLTPYVHLPLKWGVMCIKVLPWHGVGCGCGY